MNLIHKWAALVLILTCLCCCSGRIRTPKEALHALRYPCQLDAEPLYIVGWSNLHSHAKDNLSFRQRALRMQRQTGGPILIARTGKQIQMSVQEEMRLSTGARKLFFFGHGDGYGLFLGEREGIYHDTIQTQTQLRHKYGGGRQQLLFSEWLRDTLFTQRIEEAIFLSCYSAGVAYEWTRRTFQPAIGSLHLVSPVNSNTESTETGLVHSLKPFVRYRYDKEKQCIATDTLLRTFDPLLYSVRSEFDPG